MAGYLDDFAAVEPKLISEIIASLPIVIQVRVTSDGPSGILPDSLFSELKNALHNGSLAKDLHLAGADPNIAIYLSDFESAAADCLIQRLKSFIGLYHVNALRD